MRNYYIAVNAYRSSTSHGFVNTWDVFRCEDRANQKKILTQGLPYRDIYTTSYKAIYGTIGIRLATPKERREAEKEIKLYGLAAVPLVQELQE